MYRNDFLRPVVLCLAAMACAFAFCAPAHGAKLTLKLANDQGVTLVGAFNRWDQDGNPNKPVNTKAKVDVPEVDATATRTGENTWAFKDLKPGTYDLVIMRQGRVRIEGYNYPPVLEFDPFIAGDATVSDEHREFIEDDIRKSQHYENKVIPLSMGGDEKVVRVLMMLIRDKTTSYEGDFPGAATIRHEIWQYTWAYGGWKKEKRTRVIDRSLLHRDELRQWTWLWDPKLGGIQVEKDPVEIQYEIPASLADKPLKGLYPY